jgi:hypothetical protein
MKKRELHLLPKNWRILIVCLLLMAGCLRVPAWADWVPDGASPNITVTASAVNPSLAISNGVPYLAWAEAYADGNVYEAHLNGSAWQRDGDNAFEACGSDVPLQLVLVNQVAYITILEGGQIYERHWNGNSWLSDLAVPCVKSDWSFACSSGGTPYVISSSNNSAAPQNELLTVQYLNGTNWVQVGGPLNMTTGENAVSPSLAMYNSIPYVAWAETNTNNINEIYATHWTGTAWAGQGQAVSLNVNSNQNGQNPKIAIYNGTPYVAWTESDGVAGQIYVKHWNGSGWEQNGGSLNINTTMAAVNPSLALADGIPYVAWSEYSTNEYQQIYVKYWNGSAWAQDGGSLNVSTAQNAAQPSLAISNGTPYVAWSEVNVLGAHQINVEHYVQPTATPTSTMTVTMTTTPTPIPSPTSILAFDTATRSPTVVFTPIPDSEKKLKSLTAKSIRC